MSSNQRDFTRGPIARSMIAFSMPFLLSNVLQALYGAVDMLVVGRFSDPDPEVCAQILSGVNIGSQITHMVAMMVSGLTVSGTVMVGQYVGARKQRDASETVGTMFSLLGIAGAALTVLMIALADPLLHLLNTPAAAYEHAREYLIICLSGTLFIFGYNAISSIQRGLGDSVRPLIFVGIACAVNVVLDLWLVKGMGMGAAGAAWATVVAQAVSLILAGVYLARNRFIFDFRPRSFRIRKEKMKLMIKLGIPSSVQSVIVNISFLVMTAVVNGLDSMGYIAEKASAAMGVVGKFNSFAILPAVAMSSSVSAFAAQNIGAGQHERARKSLTVGAVIALAISAALFAFVKIAPDLIVSVFSEDPQVRTYGVEYMGTFCYDFLLVAVLFCCNGLIMGAGHTRFTLLTGSMSSLLLRIPVAVLFGKVLGWGLMGVGLAGPAASLASVALGIWFVATDRWKKDQTGIRREDAARREERAEQ